MLTDEEQKEMKELPKGTVLYTEVEWSQREAIEANLRQAGIKYKILYGSCFVKDE